ncbi:MAG: cob(I)yrinic acid a,c-diamide adenosyltransferase [Chlorobiota bacterium]
MALRIYTRTGDDGTTGLFGGERVSKSHPRLEAYGAVDELNAVLGIVRTYALPEELTDDLRTISSWLLIVGADLATPEEALTRKSIPTIGDEHVTWLEKRIDAYEAELPPLRNFILPGGSPAAAYLHLARTVCRRAERATVAAAQTESLNPAVVRFLNRLSDYFFVAARWANYRAGVAEEVWTAPRP